MTTVFLFLAGVDQLLSPVISLHQDAVDGSGKGSLLVRLNPVHCKAPDCRFHMVSPLARNLKEQRGDSSDVIQVCQMWNEPVGESFRAGGIIFQLNYFTSSDPHHDMLGGGCQVRVVIKNMMGRMENLRTLISGFLGLVILVRWALVTMFLSWTTQTGCRIHRTYVSLIGSGEGRHATHLLKFVLLLSTSQTDWKQSFWTSFRHSNIFWHSWHIFDHSFWHILSELLANISSDILSDLSCDILQLLLWHTLSATTTNPFHHSWGPARHTELAWSQLGSGTPHWTRRIAVEVRHTTLNSRDHSWGPARHTELAGSRLGSGTPHWTRRIAVGVRHATLNSQDRSWGPAHNTELTRSQLGSGTPHWTRRIAVGVRHATLNSQDRGWGPARHTELAGSQLRSGTQHWTHEITVGVRHATLNSQDRGWGPARHTELAGSRLGSGTPHWTRRIAVEVRHTTLNSRDHSWGPARHTELTGSRQEEDEEGGRQDEEDEEEYRRRRDWHKI